MLNRSSWYGQHHSCRFSNSTFSYYNRADDTAQRYLAQDTTFCFHIWRMLSRAVVQSENFKEVHDRPSLAGITTLLLRTDVTLQPTLSALFTESQKSLPNNRLGPSVSTQKTIFLLILREENLTKIKFKNSF